MEKFKVLLKTRVKKSKWVKLDHADSLLDKSIEISGIICQFEPSILAIFHLESPGLKMGFKDIKKRANNLSRSPCLPPASSNRLLRQVLFFRISECKTM